MTDFYRPTLSEHIEALSVGNRAAEKLPLAEKSSVTGITSQGIFLLVDEDVFFLSFGSYRGPLTVTLGRVVEKFQMLQIGSIIVCQSGKLFFPEIKMSILWDSSKVWHPPLAATSVAPPEQRLLSLQRLASGILQNKQGEQGFTPFLDILVNGKGTEYLTEELRFVWQYIPAIQRALSEKKVEDIVSCLLPLMGLGRGLTPSGDDLIAGILLALNRYPMQICPDLPRQDLNPVLIQNARKKTTRLSANIIEQAANGLADERLLKALDGIMTGENTVETSVHEICHLGHSSGADTLTGITLALIVNFYYT